jgi:hypothetical protein
VECDQHTHGCHPTPKQCLLKCIVEVYSLLSCMLMSSVSLHVESILSPACHHTPCTYPLVLTLKLGCNLSRSITLNHTLSHTLSHSLRLPSALQHSSICSQIPPLTLRFSQSLRPTSSVPVQCTSSHIVYIICITPTHTHGITMTARPFSCVPTSHSSAASKWPECILHCCCRLCTRPQEYT